MCYRFCRTVTNSLRRSRSTSAACQRAFISAACACQPFCSGESENLGPEWRAEGRGHVKFKDILSPYNGRRVGVFRGSEMARGEGNPATMPGSARSLGPTGCQFLWRPKGPRAWLMGPGSLPQSLMADGTCAT